MNALKLRVALFTVFITLVGTHLNAQRVKYKDLFPTMAGMTQEELRNALREYLSEDPDHPNANFRLALVYESNYKSGDPLTAYDFVLANAEQAKLRYLKSKMLVDEREVSRNNEYYFPVFKTFDSKGKPNVEFSTVSPKLTQGMDSASLFLNKIPPLYQSFTRSVNFYDKAVKEFAKINDSFSSLDDLYLYFDAGIDKQLNTLKLDFDSARFYFDKYLRLTKEYPIAYHKQKYHIRPVLTYRLDGLVTRTNFLTTDVELWDYATWVDQVQKSVSGDISALRKKLIFNEEKLDEVINRLNGFESQGVVPFKLDKQLVFNLNNYDKQSLVLALLDYKSFKQEWLIKYKSQVPDTISQLRNAEIFSDLIYSNRTADTLINQVTSRLATDKIRKHQDFFERFYGREEGLKKYVEDEKKFISSSFDEYRTGLRAALTLLSAPSHAEEKDKVAKFGKFNIQYAVGAVTPELLQKGNPITMLNLKNSDGSVYLLGVYILDKKVNNVVTYVACVSPDGKPAWIKNFDFKSDSLSKVPDASTLPGPVVLTKEGCVFMVRSTALTKPDSFTTLIFLNEKGEEKFKKKLKEKSYPRDLTYVERINSFIVVLKGDSEKQNFGVSEPMTLLGINTLGDALWKRNVELTGSVTEIVNVIDGCLIIGNYATISDHHGKEVRTKAGESSPYLIKLNDKGEVIKVNPIQSAKSVFVAQVIKVNGSSIHLLGYEGNFETAEASPAGKSVHIMVNRSGDPVF